MINEYFFLILGLGWFFSATLAVFSLIKYRVFTLFDFYIFLSWFYVFYRPLHIDSCDVDKDLYLWYESYYVYGVYVSCLFTLMLQVGALTFRKARLIGVGVCPSSFFLKNSVKIALLLFVLVAILMFSLFGKSVLPGNQGAGALSVSVPNLEYFFYILKSLLWIIIPFSAFLYVAYKDKKYLLFLLLAVFVVLLFGKRGALISPLILTFILVSFYYLKVLRLSWSKVVLKFFPLMLLLAFFAVFGKGVKGSDFGFEWGDASCEIVKKGMQEFDLFWPAIVDVSEDADVLEFLPSLVGGVLYSHEARLKTDMLSVTDRAMLKYNHDAYVEKKFGISPNLSQFYYYYLSIFSVFFAFFLGYFLKRLDVSVLSSFYKGYLFKYSLFLVLYKLFTGPFDFTLKYSLFEFFVLSVVVVFCAFRVKAKVFSGWA